MFTTPFDSISSGTFESTDTYKIHIKSNIVILDTMISNLSFNRNKEFFNDINKLYKCIDSVMAEKVITYSESDIEKVTVYMSLDSTESYQEILIRTPDRISQANIKIALNEMDTEKTSHYSSIPLIITDYLYYPIQLLINSTD